MRPIRNSVRAFIVQDDHVLAIKLEDPDGYWYIMPGGGQEPGESFRETLQRECLEEINTEVIIGDLRFIREYIGKNHEFASKDAEVHQIDFMFSCTLPEGAKPGLGHVPDTAQLGVEWLPVSDLDNYRLYPLGLRPLIAHSGDPTVPIYMGDIN